MKFAAGYYTFVYWEETKGTSACAGPEPQVIARTEGPDFDVTLKRLQDDSRELGERVTDDGARRTTMCTLLELSGQYVALTEGNR